LKLILQQIFGLIKFYTLPKEFREIVIYSENENYKNYYYKIIETLTYKFYKKVTYVTSDFNDLIPDTENVKSIYIGSSYLRSILFATLNCKKFLLTLTDLGSPQLRKSKLCEEYIYIFHSPISTHAGYNKKAFWHYDTIFCNGEYQINELQTTEKIYNLKKKIKVRSGYLFFEFLKKNQKHEEVKKNILFAPTWVNDENNLFEKYSLQIIQLLIDSGYKVILRPHPEHFKRSKITINKLIKNFSRNKNFYLDNNINNLDGILKSEFMITDNSGVAIEYALIFKKNIIFINSAKKINNLSYEDLKLKTIEDIVKNKFGYTINTNEIKNITNILKNLSNRKAASDLEKRKEFLNNNFFDSSKSLEIIVNHLIK